MANNDQHFPIFRDKAKAKGFSFDVYKDGDSWRVEASRGKLENYIVEGLDKARTMQLCFDMIP